jgi:hypothetical protein
LKNIAEKFASVQQNAAAGRPIDVLLFNRQMRNGPFAGIAIEGHPVDCVPGEALIDLDHKLFTGIKITFALAAHVYELPLAIRLGNKVKLVSFVVDDSHEI